MELKTNRNRVNSQTHPVNFDYQIINPCFKYEPLDIFLVNVLYLLYAVSVAALQSYWQNEIAFVGKKSPLSVKKRILGNSLKIILSC